MAAVIHQMFNGTNGTNIVIQNINGDIVGQMEMTLSFVGAPIDITNKSHDEGVEIFEGELGIKQLQISGTIVYNDDDQFRKVRHDAFNGILDTYIINYVSNATIVEIFTASMMPNGLSDAIPHGDKLTTSLTFLSSGPVELTPIKALITDVYPIVSTEEGAILGGIDIESINIVSLNFETPVMGGIIEIDELTLNTILVNYTEEEEVVLGTIEIDELTLVEILIELDSTEEAMTGTIEIEELTLADILIPYSEDEEAMTGTIEINELTLTTA